MDTSTLLIITSLFCLAAQARSHRQVCATKCGDIDNIGYPFRLKGDPAGCGDADYELSCVDNRKILELFPGRYYVKNISHDENVLRLVDVNFSNRSSSSSSSSCRLPSGSVVSYEGNVDDFRYVTLGGATRVYTQFGECDRKLSQSDVAAYNYTEIPCLSTNGTYFYAVYDIFGITRLKRPHCSLISVAPSDYRVEIEHVAKPLSYDAVVRELEAGFDLAWSVVCRDCRLGGKYCGVYVGDQYTKPLIWRCSKGEYKELTEAQIILIYVGIALAALFGLVLIVILSVWRYRKYRRRRREKNLQNRQRSSTATISNS